MGEMFFSAVNNLFTVKQMEQGKKNDATINETFDIF